MMFTQRILFHFQTPLKRQLYRALRGFIVEYCHTIVSVCRKIDTLRILICSLIKNKSLIHL